MAFIGGMSAGDAAFAAGDPHTAIALYTQDLADWSSVINGSQADRLADTYRKRAQCHYTLHDYEASLRDAALSLAREKNSVPTLLLKAQGLVACKRFHEAYSVFRQALDLEPYNQIIAKGLHQMRLQVGSETQSAEWGDNNSGSTDVTNLHPLTPLPGDRSLKLAEQDLMVRWELDQPAVTKRVGCDQDAAEGVSQGRSKRREDGGNLEGWMQRAAVLAVKGDLREAFRCCLAVAEADRTLDVWKMGGSVLDKLGLPVSSEDWLRQAVWRSTHDDNSANILFQNVRARRLYAPLTKGTAVEVIFTPIGRGVKAVKAISKGEVVFADAPTLHAQTLPSLRFPCCAACVTSLIGPADVFSAQELQQDLLQKAVKKHWPVRSKVACSAGCSREVYCSERCRDEAWDAYHRLLCPQKNAAVARLHDVCDAYQHLTRNDVRVFHGWWNASFSPLLLAKLWAFIACRAQILAREAGHAVALEEDRALAGASFSRFVSSGPGSNADAISKMYQLMKEIFKNLEDGLGFDITKEEFDFRYFQLSCNVQSFSDSDNPMAHFTKGIGKDPKFAPLLSLARRKEHEGDFAGLFSLHASMNHSCANNAVVSDGRTPDGRVGCVIKAVRDILVDDEVCNQYIDTTLGRKERRLMLYWAYNFWCRCPRCQFEGDGPNECCECDKKSPDKPLPQCGRCKHAWYCSSACQKKAWKRGHKKICTPMT